MKTIWFLLSSFTKTPKGRGDLLGIRNKNWPRGWHLVRSLFLLVAGEFLRNFAANISVEFHDPLVSVCWKSGDNFSTFLDILLLYMESYVRYERASIPA